MMPLRRPPRRGFINWAFPLSLFRGSVGAWLDINGLFRLFTTAAGATQAAAINDPVGRAEAIVGTNALNSTDAQRPILKTLPSGSYCLYHDRVDDKLTLANMPAGTYTVGFATFAGVQIYNILQSSLGTLSIPGVDYTEALIINRVLTASETNQLRTYLSAKAEPVGATDVLRIYCSSNSVNLAITESGGSSGATWELGDGQTASGTSCVKTITAPKSVILRATDKTKIQQIDWSNKSLFGQFPDLSALTGLTVFSCPNNALTGKIPDISANTKLTIFQCYVNQMTGPLPNISNNVALTVFQCHDNNYLAGPFPDISNNTELTVFACSGSLTGVIPNLSAHTKLTTFWARGTSSSFLGKINGYAGGEVPVTLGDFLVDYNMLPAAAVNAILAAFVAAGRDSGTRRLNVGGKGNAAPTGQGLTDKATLISRGWTVTTN